ncbi:hypothetical protein [Microbacterium sp. PA5]|uniref:hypothetical protein n=1 Tax=Microbacterium sp. PA5 TaxID=3416654 RepID=UPI003CE7985C
MNAGQAEGNGNQMKSFGSSSRRAWGAVIAVLLAVTPLVPATAANAATPPAWAAREAAHDAGLAAVATLGINPEVAVERTTAELNVPGRTWYVDGTVTQTRTYFYGETGSTEYVIAAREALLASGFVRDGRISGIHGTLSTVSNFVSSTLMCQIDRSFARTQSLAQVWIRCIDRSTLATIVDRYRPFLKLIAALNPARLENAVFHSLSTRSGTPGYVSGRVFSWSARVPNAGFYFAKPPGGKWVYVTGTAGSLVTCAALEKTTVSRKAFAGDLCIRYGEVSTVRG